MSIADYHREDIFNHPANYGIFPKGYTRANKFLIWDHDHYFARDAFGIKPREGILLVGAGFGWVAEDWIREGLGPICAVDTSQWIQSRKIIESQIPIYPYDVNDVSDQILIKQTIGCDIEWCITEDMISCLSDEECVILCKNLRQLGRRVAHIISPTTDRLPQHNYKTKEEWKTFLYPDAVFLRSECILL